MCIYICWRVCVITMVASRYITDSDNVIAVNAQQNNSTRQRAVAVMPIGVEGSGRSKALP